MVGLGLGLLLVAAPALTRVARSEEMGRTSAFPSSDKASIITGASIVADDGMMAQ